jgi:sugar/nucleoside kinase (ribokinase family)
LRWSLGLVGALHAVAPATHNPTAIDACGAGDWFTSALLFGLAQAHRKPADLSYTQLAALMRHASGVAAWSCSFLGARGGLYDSPVPALFEQLHVAPSHPAAPLKRPISRVEDADHCVYA